MGHHVLCDPSTLSFVESKIRSSTVFVVSKSGCKACMKAKKLLNELVAETGSTPYVFDVDILGGRKAKKVFVKWLSSKTGIKTVPQIWINGRFVGGNDDIQKKHSEGRLVPLILMKTRRNSVYGRQSWHSDVPIYRSSTSYVPHRKNKGHLGAHYPFYTSASGNKKWDSWMTKPKPISNYTVVRKTPQLRAKSRSWSSITAPERFGLPEAQGRISSSGKMISNSSFMKFPNKSERMKEWMIDGTCGINGWI